MPGRKLKPEIYHFVEENVFIRLRLSLVQVRFSKFMPFSGTTEISLVIFSKKLKEQMKNPVITFDVECSEEHFEKKWPSVIHHSRDRLIFMERKTALSTSEQWKRQQNASISPAGPCCRALLQGIATFANGVLLHFAKRALLNENNSFGAKMKNIRSILCFWQIFLTW
jgi:hypothetical protein